jgi:hypothetical protein
MPSHPTALGDRVTSKFVGTPTPKNLDATWPYKFFSQLTNLDSLFIQCLCWLPPWTGSLQNKHN